MPRRPAVDNPVQIQRASRTFSLCFTHVFTHVTVRVRPVLHISSWPGVHGERRAVPRTAKRLTRLTRATAACTCGHCVITRPGGGDSRSGRASPSWKVPDRPSRSGPVRLRRRVPLVCRERCLADDAASVLWMFREDGACMPVITELSERNVQSRLVPKLHKHTPHQEAHTYSSSIITFSTDSYVMLLIWCDEANHFQSFQLIIYSIITIIFRRQRDEPLMSSPHSTELKWYMPTCSER